MARLYVGNLNYETDADALREAFAAFGELTEVEVIIHPRTGKSRGYAFVAFADDDAAEAAIAALNERELDGRAITVKPAKPRPGYA